MKKILTGLLAVFLLAGCTSSQSSQSSSSTAEAAASAAAVDDQALADYLSADDADLKYSYVLEDGKMSKWYETDNNQDVAELNAKIKDSLSKSMNEISEDDLSDDALVFELQPAMGEAVYIYGDGKVKTSAVGSRHFYELSDISVIAEIQDEVDTLQGEAE